MKEECSYDAGSALEGKQVASDDPLEVSALAPSHGGNSSHDALEVEADPVAPQQERQLPRFYPYVCGRPLDGGNQGPFAWALDTAGRGVSWIGAGAFLATALLRLAKEAAGCETTVPPRGSLPKCDGRVYGIRPSSLLTTYTIVIGVLSAMLIPLMGAIVDYTSVRLKLGRIMTAICCILLFPQMFISQQTWFAVAIIQKSL